MKKKTITKEKEVPLHIMEYMNMILEKHREGNMNFNINLAKTTSRLLRDEFTHALQKLEGTVETFKEKVTKIEQDVKDLVAFFTKFAKENEGRVELQRRKLEQLPKLSDEIEGIKEYSKALYEDLREARKRLLVCESKQEVLIQVIKR